jgi:hypothetical protein
MSGSDTWYYPLDAAHRRAIAIEFAGAVARSARFIDAPTRPHGDLLRLSSR